MRKGIALVVFALASIAAVAKQCAGSNPDIDQYNIVWTSQSKDSSESMPVGGHDIGLNVWVEKGDLLFYAQRSGCFDENNEYLKLGRVRLQLDPNPFAEDADFRQELQLRQGYAEIVGQKDDLKTTVHIWVEVHRPVVHLDIQSSQPISAEVAYEGWRNEDVELPALPSKTARFGCFGWDFYPGKVERYADVVTHEDNGVLFYHRNKDDKLIFDYTARQQGLETIKDQLVNTQKGRTFGGYLTGEGFIPVGTDEGTYVITPYKAWKLKTKKPRKTHAIKLFCHLAQTETLDEWLNGLNTLTNTKNPSDKAALKKTLDWWDTFWQRSWLMINPQKADPKSPIWQAGRNYQLFRYQLGCNAYGTHPTKFNGGNFTYDPSLVDDKRTFTPDWRSWGGGSITAMNQRLVHWPMLKSGDFDLMIPQFEFYRIALPNATARVKTYWEHDGCLFTEQLENFGLPLASHWGWTEPDAKGRTRSPGLVDHGVQANYPCRYHYLSQLAFAYMILEYHRYTDKDISQYMDFVKQSVVFFDEHYQMRNKKTTGKPLDENGKLVIFPSAGCETYKGAKNPTDILAGLNACVKGILMLPENYISSEERAYYKGLLSRIPGYAYDQIQGDRVIKPAWSWEKAWNEEIPHLYTLFPFDQFVLGQDDMTVFRNTWKHDEVYPKEMVVSWHQDAVFLARMGMTQEAVDFNAKRMADSPQRFPTFWGPNYDWLPDHNWGGVGMIGMQEMLMQTVGKKIRLLPAWPKEWDVDFKLHAPYATTVEGKVRSGKLTDLKVIPKERLKDVIVMNADHD